MTSLNFTEKEKFYLQRRKAWYLPEDEMFKLEEALKKKLECMPLPEDLLDAQPETTMDDELYIGSHRYLDTGNLDLWIEKLRSVNVASDSLKTQGEWDKTYYEKVKEREDKSQNKL